MSWSSGTIESRKNVWTIALVWQEIYRRLGLDTPRLVFAGKQGWAKGAFDDFLRGTGNLDGYIRIVDRPDDAELAYLYEHCLFSVSASYYEGWGLPIGEGLWFGRPVVASNVSAMPEVGGSLVEYVDPYDPKSNPRRLPEADHRRRLPRDHGPADPPRGSAPLVRCGGGYLAGADRAGRGEGGGEDGCGSGGRGGSSRPRELKQAQISPRLRKLEWPLRPMMTWSCRVTPTVPSARATALVISDVGPRRRRVAGWVVVEQLQIGPQ